MCWYRLHKHHAALPLVVEEVLETGEILKRRNQIVSLEEQQNLHFFVGSFLYMAYLSSLLCKLYSRNFAFKRIF